MISSIATCHGVEKDNIWIGNFIEHLVGIVHGGSGWVGSAGINELSE